MPAERPGSTPSGPPRKRPSGAAGVAFAVANALDLPFVLVGAMVVGGLLGWLADQWLGTSPVLTLVMGVIGFAAGIYEVLRRLKLRAGRDGGK